MGVAEVVSKDYVFWARGARDRMFKDPFLGGTGERREFRVGVNGPVQTGSLCGSPSLSMQLWHIPAWLESDIDKVTLPKYGSAPLYYSVRI